MNNINVKTVSLSCLALAFLSVWIGCSRVLVKTTDFADDVDIRRLDPNGGPLFIEFKRDYQKKVITYVQKICTGLSPSTPCRIRYDRTYFDNYCLVIVAGELQNGRTYPVYVDTGYQGVVEISGNIVSENDLAIYPLGQNRISSVFGGLCYLPSLQLGQLRIKDPLTHYSQWHWEWQLFRWPLRKESAIFVGLNLLRQFQYVLFDNRKREVEFSRKQLFVPNHSGHWESYPFTLKVDQNEQLRLMVDLPIAGEITNVMFDTCGGCGIHVGSAAWSEFTKRVAPGKIQKRRYTMPEVGWVEGQSASIPTLEIANQIVKNGQVAFEIESKPYCQADDWWMGMGCFKDTAVVLDFNRNLVWIKNQESD